MKTGFLIRGRPWRATYVLLLAACAVFASSLAGLAGETVRYRYDSFGRLRSACYIEVGKLVTYSYDAAGNRTATVTTASNCPANGAPRAVDDQISGSFDLYVFVTVYPLVNDTDAEGDALSITSASCITGGCGVTVLGSRLEIHGTTPGTKSVSYTIADGHGGISTGVVTISSFEDPTSCGSLVFCP